MTFEPSLKFKIAMGLGFLGVLYVAIAGPTQVGVIPFAINGFLLGVVFSDFLTFD